jgi:hypothetical protein
MRFLKIIFSILTVISLFFSLAIFIAGSLIFLNIQFYEQIHQLAGPWAAYSVILLEIILFSYAAIGLIGNMFHNIFYDKKSSNGSRSKDVIDKKILFGLLAYELLKLLYVNKSRK